MEQIWQFGTVPNANPMENADFRAFFQFANLMRCISFYSFYSLYREIGFPPVILKIINSSR